MSSKNHPIINIFILGALMYYETEIKKSAHLMSIAFYFIFYIFDELLCLSIWCRSSASPIHVVTVRQLQRQELRNKVITYVQKFNFKIQRNISTFWLRPTYYYIW